MAFFCVFEANCVWLRTRRFGVQIPMGVPFFLPVFGQKRNVRPWDLRRRKPPDARASNPPGFTAEPSRTKVRQIPNRCVPFFCPFPGKKEMYGHEDLRRREPLFISCRRRGFLFAVFSFPEPPGWAWAGRRAGLCPAACRKRPKTGG